jgi:hypothetical protein
MVYESAWWSIELPPGWSGKDDGVCATFVRTPELGALQVSSARKDTEEAVTDEDLAEFATERLPSNVRPRETSVGVLSGLTAVYEHDQNRWQEWWLKSGYVMIYVTYNVHSSADRCEQDEAARILTTLKVKVVDGG